MSEELEGQVEEECCIECDAPCGDLREDLCPFCYDQLCCTECGDFIGEVGICEDCLWDRRNNLLSNLTEVDEACSYANEHEETLAEQVDSKPSDWWVIQAKTDWSEPHFFVIKAETEQLADQAVLDLCERKGIVHYMTLKTQTMEAWFESEDC